MDSLTAQIAKCLGWTEGEVQSFPLQTLREIVRPVNPKLAHEMTCCIEQGTYLTERSRS